MEIAPQQSGQSIREYMRKKYGAQSVLESGTPPGAPAADLTAGVGAPAPTATTTGETSSVGTSKSEAQILVEALSKRLDKLP